MKKVYEKPQLHKLNPQDLVDKEGSFLRHIKNGVLQIIALSGEDAISKSEKEKLHNAILPAISILIHIYEMELKIAPVDSEIIKQNLAITNKIEELFKKNKYEEVSKLLKKLQP
ncbi:MAG: hypothetical protein PHF86_10740 [Candidatus Nanoarchaeia archaeon]|nr:hypothetical protein [Candidatus Nanoarchaeia archaeon]